MLLPLKVNFWGDFAPISVNGKEENSYSCIAYSISSHKKRIANSVNFSASVLSPAQFSLSLRGEGVHSGRRLVYHDINLIVQCKRRAAGLLHQCLWECSLEEIEKIALAPFEQSQTHCLHSSCSYLGENTMGFCTVEQSGRFQMAALYDMKKTEASRIPAYNSDVMLQMPVKY